MSLVVFGQWDHVDHVDHNQTWQNTALSFRNPPELDIKVLLLKMPYYRFIEHGKGEFVPGRMLNTLLTSYHIVGKGVHFTEGEVLSTVLLRIELCELP